MVDHIDLESKKIKINYCLLQELYLSQVLLFCVFFVPSTYHIIVIITSSGGAGCYAIKTIGQPMKGPTQ
ncbi:Cancer-Associated 1 Protein [Manis pentadactyla]|nr:Cancer-Associated 1 Protein [Manis pentadactyla]